MFFRRSSFHQKKGWIQKVTPLIAIMLMSLMSCLSENRYLWPEVAILLCFISCSAYLCVEMFQICLLQQHDLKKHTTSRYDFFCGFGSALSALHSLVLLGSEESFYQLSYGKEGVLYVLFFLIIELIFLRLIHTSIQNQRQPLCCYSYWPANPFYRLPSLFLYYATSNGLFTFFLILIGFFICKIFNIPQRDLLGSSDAIVFAGYVFIILILAKIASQFRSIFTSIKKYSNIILLASWTSHLFFIIFWAQHPSSFLSFSSYQYLFLNLDFLQDSLGFREITIVSFLPILGYFWGSYWAFKTKSLPTALSILLWAAGLLSGYYFFLLSIQNRICFFLSQSLFILSLLLFLFAKKIPLHQMDAPWHTTTRKGLGVKRWLLSMILAPLFFSTLIALNQLHIAYRIIDSFGSLIELAILWIALAQFFDFLFIVTRRSLIQRSIFIPEKKSQDHAWT